MQEAQKLLVRKVFEKRGELYQEHKNLVQSFYLKPSESYEVTIDKYIYVALVYIGTLYEIKSVFPEVVELNPKDIRYNRIKEKAKPVKKLRAPVQDYALV